MIVLMTLAYGTIIHYIGPMGYKILQILFLLTLVVAGEAILYDLGR